jgi:hypothetical protein
MTNAAWAADVEHRQTETRGRAEREKKLVAKRAATADELARLVSMAMGQPRVGQFLAGSWPTLNPRGDRRSSGERRQLRDQGMLTRFLRRPWIAKS